MEELKNKVYNSDARNLNELINKKIVDVTITSPPYFDLKDYGYENQIGFGQSYEDYLEDLRKVFKNVYDCTKDSGTLWVIIDAFRRDGEVIPLPFDFSNKIAEIGWKLQEVIIWGKDRTVPWTHKGQMRNLFEYILLFSKSSKYKFFVDEVRDFHELKKWWVKYPERYNPKGKTPDAIWHFDIPTQGSWGDGYIKHFCPLPEELIAQILKLTTKEGDLVLDPFAGSGAVLSKANNMKRNYVGVELNQEYIAMFNNYLQETGTEKRKKYEQSIKNNLSQEKFKKLIINLRALKFGRILHQQITKKYSAEGIKVMVEKLKQSITQRHAIAVVKYVLLIPQIKKENSIKLMEEMREICSEPPLSKFGIEPIFEFVKSRNDFVKLMDSGKYYTYKEKSTHHYSSKFDSERTMKSTSEIIISKIFVDLVEKDYE